MSTDDYRERESTLSKLKDASLLIFVITALSLTASVAYVRALSGSLGIDLTRYLEIKDYLQITAQLALHSFAGIRFLVPRVLSF
jgi:hypothetical protein